MRGRAMSLPTEELGRLIVERRGSRGVRAAAADVGISSATLSRVENGHMPDLETFAKICKWLGKDPREFLGFEREEAASPPAVVQFKKDRTVSKDTAIALGELILAAQEAMRARAKLSG
jgi:transcriptional regulator with XRE-family HTH domain